ncbi:uncharacterized protein [Procambarus clarkii]|uniref:uncharacterized protein n=1 Tax=Procambarus clarkii TaxID=6728 RepID=UPI001E671787|nr:uncharacterized protein LOC123763301 [Procambarus clarkii]
MSNIYTPEDFAFAKLYKCVHVPGQKAMCDVARAMYADSRMNTKGGTMSLRDFCTQTGKKENEFDNHLDDNIMVVEFDITFAFKLMSIACNTLYSDLNCQAQINNLKLLRNEINHNYSKAEDSMKDTCDKLKTIIKDIYKGVGLVVNQNFDTEYSNAVKILDEIIAAKVQAGNVATIDDIMKFKKDKIFVMTTEGRDELHANYQNLKILNPFIILLDDFHKIKDFRVDKIFTPLEIEDRKGDIDMKEILTVTTRVSYTGEERLPGLLLFHGLPGCGKTSLCRYLIDKWLESSTEIDGLSNFDLVILVEVRRTVSGNVLEYLSEQLMHETCGKFKEEDIISILKELSILFIIDGYDEKTDRSSGLVKDIFKNFGDKRIIITTRPEKLKEAVNIAKKCNIYYLEIKVCGFDDDRLKEFSKKLFREIINKNDYDMEISNFFKYIDGPGRVLDEHLKLPLTTSLLIILWKHDSEIVNQVTTLTRLYQELFWLCQERLARRLSSKCAVPYQKIKGDLAELLIHLGDQAWIMLQAEMYTLQENNLTEICKICDDKKLLSQEVLAAFLTCEADKNSKEKYIPVYEFFHRSQMEYFAAEFLSDCIKKKKFNFKDVANQPESWESYQEVIKYLTGHLASQKILEDKVEDLFSLIAKAGIEDQNYNFWWNILNESQPVIRNKNNKFEKVAHPKINTIIAKDKLRNKDWNLDHTNVVSALKLLSFTPVQPNSLKIEIEGNKNPQKLPMFLDVMEGVGNKLKERKTRRMINVDLALLNHERYECQNTSESFLDALESWANLTNFTGSLEKPKNLSNYRSIKTIRVKVTNLEALESLRNLQNTRTLRITLQLSPNDYQAEHFPDLEYKGNLEISMLDLKDHHQSWIVEVVKRLGKGCGCWRLSLQFSDVKNTTIEWLVKKLKNYLSDKLTIKSNIEQSDVYLETLNMMAAFDVVWLT